VRLFVALNLPADLRERIDAEVMEPLRTRVPGVRWVRPETLHVTLAYLGERSDAEAREAAAAVRDLAGRRVAPQVMLRGIGVFPNADRPRVVWLGIVDPAPVRELHRAFERERARLGLPAEGRAYHPHVTLGRVPPDAEAAAREPLAEVAAAVSFEATVTLPSVDLMHSEQTPTGARYTALAVAALGHTETA
jgi:2'-5' RNA ligase